jgi:hypothetical protein
MFSNKNRKQLFGETMRHERDFYPTPQSIIDAVLFHVKQGENATIWEPCAGDGRFSTALEQSGYRVISHDIDEGHDFFDWKTAQAPIIVTNPPFKYIRRFIDHSFKIGVEQMVLVTPERLWACQKGYEQLLRHRPSRFANLTWREDYLQKGGSPDRSLAISIWDSPCAETTAYEVWQRVENEIEYEAEQTPPVPHYKEPIPCDFCGALTRGRVVEDRVECDACHAVLV